MAGPGKTVISRDLSSEEEPTMSTFEVRARLRVRDGQLEGFKRQAAEMMRQTREKDTGTLAYDWFLSDDGTQCEVREAYVDADALVDHAFHVRQARDVMFEKFAYDHKMTFFGQPSPRLVELVDKIGVNVTFYTLLQALEPASVH
jgi:quinol monooxygenase YgiN